jgi:DNA repair exonuclease SbcCD nuclease subunit
MLFGVTADWHDDRKIGGKSRYDEIEAFRHQFQKECLARDVDLIVHLGDWADPGADELRNLTRISEQCASLREHAREGLVTITGNHDVVLGTEQMSMLSPIERMSKCLSNRPIQVFEQPGIVHTAGRGVQVIAAPYPYDTRDFAKPSGSYHDTLKRRLEQASESSSTVVLLSHLMLGEVERGEESGELSRGDECMLPGYAIEAVDIILQGHYHRRQRLWAVSGEHRAEVFIPGSPIRHTFGEKDDREKGWWFVDV